VFTLALHVLHTAVECVQLQCYSTDQLVKHVYDFEIVSKFCSRVTDGAECLGIIEVLYE
jgi:hypothetical protein